MGPDGARAYAVGDVHGCVDLLRDLLDKIERDNAVRRPATTYLVLLGDLVDRGPDSRGVIDLFVNTPPQWARLVYIKGNHDDYFAEVLAGASNLVPAWLAYGGQECLESYGLSRGWTLNASPEAIEERLRREVPSAHQLFLQEMTDTFSFGDYLFVHAGIRPGVPLEKQTARDLRLIREGFLDDRTDHGVVVVHGHTIVAEPEVYPNRIALDTGAYRTGCLTALGLEGTERWFIQAREKSESEHAAGVGIVGRHG
jgi:serine/threonine protein phosphatase 1